MLDLGVFEPAKTLPTETDIIDGSVQKARFTTTDEQRREAIAWIVKELGPSVETEASAQILWESMDTTVLTVKVSIEHLDGAELKVVDSVSETTLNGAEVHWTEAQRYGLLEREVADLHESNML